MDNVEGTSSASESGSGSAHPDSNAGTKPLVTYVFPVYNEAGNLRLLYETLTELMDQHDEYEYEMLFVNDYSTDASLELLRELEAHDERIRVIEFSRNFGHQIAVTAGLDHARGDAVIIMDSDMQDPPHVSFELLEKWREGYDVVYAQRRSRKDTVFKRVTANVYYRLLRFLTSVDIPRNTGDFRLVDRQVVDQVVQLREHSRFLRGLFAFVGFRQIAVPFDRDERHAGKSSYPLRKMLRLAADGVMSLSSTPLKIVTRIGYTVAAIGFLWTVWLVISKLVWPQFVVQGWTMIMSVLLLASGIQMILMGVIGSYIGRIYTEVQDRPLYFVQTKPRDSRP
jgi:dolichol-phosphate mannosyltransferase